MQNLNSELQRLLSCHKSTTSQGKKEAMAEASLATAFDIPRLKKRSKICRP